MHTAYIGIGSNIGDRLQNCKAAIDLLKLYPEIKVTRVSRWYKTEAVTLTCGAAVQPDYINGAAEIATSLSPEALLARLMEVEARMGRPKHRPKGEPRTIDLDLILYGNAMIEQNGLTVPHPGLPKRLFVLVPLCDIAPDVVDPRSGLTLSELRALCSATPNPPHTEVLR